jgi:threonine/homoserine/homoserine lactone efflux protein
VPIQGALLKMSMYVSLVLIVPGQTNTLLLSSGLKVGVRGTWPLVIDLAPVSRIP